jgi:hypothetical protein
MVTINIYLKQYINYFFLNYFLDIYLSDFVWALFISIFTSGSVDLYECLTHTNHSHKYIECLLVSLLLIKVFQKNL